MEDISEYIVAVEKGGRIFRGGYSHVEGVLTVTAFGASVSKVQRSIVYSGALEERAKKMLDAMAESGRIDPEA